MSKCKWEFAVASTGEVDGETLYRCCSVCGRVEYRVWPGCAAHMDPWKPGSKSEPTCELKGEGDENQSQS